MAPPRQNLTGFDPRKLAASTGSPANDPWKRYEAWRYTGPFSRYNRLIKGTFPGLGLGTGAFAIYLLYDAFVAKDNHHHGDQKDQQDHH